MCVLCVWCGNRKKKATKKKKEKKKLAQQRSTSAWAWTAPEALRSGFYSHKCDVYSMGVAFWEILTRGQRPYHSQTKGLGARETHPSTCVVDEKLTLEVPQHVAEGTPGSGELVRKCLAYDPVNRPTASELLPWIQAQQKQETGYSSRRGDGGLERCAKNDDGCGEAGIHAGGPYREIKGSGHLQHESKSRSSALSSSVHALASLDSCSADLPATTAYAHEVARV